MKKHILFFAALLALASCENDSVSSQRTSCQKVTNIHKTYSSATGYTYSLSISGETQSVNESTYSYYSNAFVNSNGDVCWDGNK